MLFRSDNGSWSISVDSSTGEASIVAQGKNTRNTIRYNKASKLFSCYQSQSGQEAVVIYKYHASSNAKDLVSKINNANTCSDYVNADTYNSDYNNLDSEDKIFFDRSFIKDIDLNENEVELTCRNKLDFMNSMNANKQGGSSVNVNSYLSSKNNIAFILIIGFLGLTSVVGYYLIQKRRLSR